MIKILFIKNKELKKGGVAEYQNCMLHLFNESPNFRLLVIIDDIDEKLKIRSKYLFMHIIIFLLRYVYLTIQIKNHIKNMDYLFVPSYFRYGLFAILISSLFRIPFIIPLLGWEEKELRLRKASKIETFLKLEYSSLVYGKAKCILTSEDLMKGYSKIVKNKNKFLVISPPIDTKVFTPDSKSEVLKNKLKVNNKKVILTATALYGVKAEGLKVLIEALFLIKKEYNNAILLIAGEGPRKKELENIAKEMNAKDSIRFLGYCDNLPELINLSDVFTLIYSFGGGIAFSIMEAMACEKPCVLSKTSGTKILTNRKEVLLVNYDARDIADKIILLLNDENYARKIGINARKRIETEYSIEKTEEKIVKKLSVEKGF